MPFELENLVLEDGRCPMAEWLDSLDDAIAARAVNYIKRLEQGNFGNCRNLANADGLFEVRMDFGAGYRAYCGRDGATVILLLCGGDKSSQRRDIARAVQLWNLYKSRRQP